MGGEDNQQAVQGFFRYIQSNVQELEQEKLRDLSSKFSLYNRQYTQVSFQYQEPTQAELEAYAYQRLGFVKDRGVLSWLTNPWRWGWRGATNLALLCSFVEPLDKFKKQCDVTNTAFWLFWKSEQSKRRNLVAEDESMQRLRLQLRQEKEQKFDVGQRRLLRFVHHQEQQQMKDISQVFGASVQDLEEKLSSATL